MPPHPVETCCPLMVLLVHPWNSCHMGGNTALSINAHTPFILQTHSSFTIVVHSSLPTHLQYQKKRRGWTRRLWTHRIPKITPPFPVGNYLRDLQCTARRIMIRSSTLFLFVHWGLMGLSQDPSLSGNGTHCCSVLRMPILSQKEFVGSTSGAIANRPMGGLHKQSRPCAGYH